MNKTTYSIEPLYICWNAEATEALINARSKHNYLFLQKKGASTQAGWQKVSEEINIPINKCIFKWKALTRIHKQRSKDKDPKETWKYHDLMESFIKRNNAKEVPVVYKNEILEWEEGSMNSPVSCFIKDSANSTISSSLKNSSQSQDCESFNSTSLTQPIIKNEPKVILTRLDFSTPNVSRPNSVSSKEVLEDLASTAALIDNIVETPLASSFKSYLENNNDAFSFSESCSNEEESNSALPKIPSKGLHSKKKCLSKSKQKRRKLGLKNIKKDVSVDNALTDVIKRLKRDLNEQAKVRQKILDLIETLKEKFDSEDLIQNKEENENGS